MLATVLAVLPLLGAPASAEMAVPAGREIALDGIPEEAEWADAFAARQDAIRFHVKRNGPWIALAVAGEGPYRSEALHVYVSDEAGAFVTALYFGVGHGTLPPLLWRRGTPAQLAQSPSPGEAPRACRARVRVEDPERWSAEYLVRASAFGIGRGEKRRMRAHVAVSRPPERDAPALLLVPEGWDRDLDVSGYARLVSADGWGAAETWPPVPAAVSREFDDNGFLFRLFLEHERAPREETPEALPIGAAVRPRSAAKIRALRERIEGARSLNPTLPAWTYFLGRLLHEANLFAEARAVVEGIPEPLRAVDPFPSLITEHYIDTEEWQAAIDFCKEHPDTRGVEDTFKMAVNGRNWAAEEAAAREEDAEGEPNPQVRIVTSKGSMLCELFEDDAPNAVRNFMDLVLARRYYDGLRFDVVIGGNLAESGDPRTRQGAQGDADGPGWTVTMDPGARNPLRGSLSMAPVEGAWHGSRFVIALAPLLRESRDLRAFGRILEGQDVAESLETGDALLRVEVVRKRQHAYDAMQGRKR